MIENEDFFDASPLGEQDGTEIKDSQESPPKNENKLVDSKKQSSANLSNNVSGKSVVPKESV